MREDADAGNTAAIGGAASNPDKNAALIDDEVREKQVALAARHAFTFRTR